MASASLYSVLTPISENTGIPVSTLNAGTGYSGWRAVLTAVGLTAVFLLLGWGALITQPLALTFGKRPVYLITGVCHLVSTFTSRNSGVSGLTLRLLTHLRRPQCSG